MARSFFWEAEPAEAENATAADAAPEPPAEEAAEAPHKLTPEVRRGADCGAGARGLRASC